ncbi:MAG: acyltransferase family protein [Amphritea sp.]
MSALKYRADIDGLRALAIIPVVLFHAGVEWCAGGYVGVDIFFVISGYLITSIIYRDIASQSFSYADFYDRRIRRIFPALFFMLVVVTGVCWISFLPKDLNDFGQSLMATMGMLSNVHFYGENGYFDGPSELKPLLHTWSLAVEEQYYLLFPFLLGFALKRSIKFAGYMVILTFLVSLLLAERVVREEVEAAFFLPQYRAWELLLGSMLAIGVFPVIGHKWRELLAWCGLLMIVYSIFDYSSETRFPGLAAVLPCFGAGLIIYAGSNKPCAVSRLLALRPLVLVGLISYSLYLWHWPLFAFRHYYFVEYSAVSAYVLIVVAFVLAWFSWQFIEKPFRTKSIIKERAVISRMAIVASLVLVIIGAVIDIKDGVPERFDDRLRQFVFDGVNKHKVYDQCSKLKAKDVNVQTLCTLGEQKQSVKTFLLWGDSHAEMLAPALNKVAKDTGSAGYLASKSSCVPLPHITVTRRNGAPNMSCAEFNRNVLELISEEGITDVVIAARWAMHVNGSLYGNEYGRVRALVDLKNSALTQPATIVARGLADLMEQLQESSVRLWVVNQVPEIGHHVPRAILSSILLSKEIAIQPRIVDYHRRTQAFDNILNRLHESYDFNVLKPAQYLCEEVCKVMVGGSPIYRDDDHLSTYGAEWLSPLFNPLLK